MSFRGIIFVALLATSVFAKPPTVRRAWVNTYPHQALNMMSDNVGHIVVFGTEIDQTGTPTNTAPLFMLNARGKEIASVSSVSGEIAADRAGRIFVLSSDFAAPELRCTAFAPLLSRILWSNQMTVTNLAAPSPVLWIRGFIPDEAGGAYAFGELSRVWNQQFFIAQLGPAAVEPAVFRYFSRDGYSRQAVGAARAPNGRVYCIGSVNVLYVSEPIILSYVPGSSQHAGMEYRPGPPTSRSYNAVASDKSSNLIFAGGYKREAFYRSISQCLIEKRSPDLNPTWSATHTAGHFASARAALVDSQANIIVLCSHGVTKYSSDGQLLWQVEGAFQKVEVDTRGNIFVLESIADGSVERPSVTKLGPDGERVWQVQDETGAMESSYVSSLVPDDRGGVYVATQSLQFTTIGRFVDGPRRR